MTPYYADEAAVALYHGDALEVLRALPDASVDAVVTDPPYGLEFMGKEWDSFKPATGKWGQDHDHKPTITEMDDTPHHRAAIRQPSVLKRCTHCGGNSAGNWNRCACAAPDFRQPAWPMQAFQRWCEQWAAECLRVLKPGGHLLAFGGTRTVHRMTCAIEDAGFEIRDGIDWIYASGFPKSLDVSKAIDKAAGAQREVVGKSASHGLALKPGSSTFVGEFLGERPAAPDITAPATDDARRWSGWGTALKPAREPIVVARKPLVGTVAANVLAYGTGALNIDACRVGDQERTNHAGGASSLQRVSRVEQGYRSTVTTSVGEASTVTGRWPSNVVLSHAPDCTDVCLPGCPVAELDQQSGSVGANPVGRLRRTYAYAQDGQVPSDQPFDYGDTGGASRFFPVFRYKAKAPSAERPRTADGTAHPTVKPLDLMRWLVRLVTPAGGTVLEPFAGSGTTAEACVLEGFRCIAIEREAAYLPLIVARLTKPLQPSLDVFGGVA